MIDMTVTCDRCKKGTTYKIDLSSVTADNIVKMELPRDWSIKWGVLLCSEHAEQLEREINRATENLVSAYIKHGG